MIDYLLYPGPVLQYVDHIIYDIFAGIVIYLPLKENFEF